MYKKRKEIFFSGIVIGIIIGLILVILLIAIVLAGIRISR